jgi:hypothetical protein
MSYFFKWFIRYSNMTYIYMYIYIIIYTYIHTNLGYDMSGICSFKMFMRDSQGPTYLPLQCAVA